jgi:hypothetical protein
LFLHSHENDADVGTGTGADAGAVERRAGGSSSGAFLCRTPVAFLKSDEILLCSQTSDAEMDIGPVVQ